MKKFSKVIFASTNQNIENKRFERFFFRDPKNTFGAKTIALYGNVRDEYIELILDYRSRHADTIKKWKRKGNEPNRYRTKKNATGKITGYDSAFSRFIIEKERDKIIKDGELVYAMLSGTVEAPTVEFIVPVAVPRVGFERKMSQLLPQHLWKCDHYEHLCPACRTFGWVQGLAGEEEKKRASENACAGRVQVRHAKPNGEVQTMNGHAPLPLAILSSPKPTTTYFYLKPSNGKPRPGLDEWTSGYDNPDNVLRGRKFYRHHGHAGESEYWKSSGREYRVNGRNRSDQNRSVADAAAPGTRFTFELRFENLAEIELGALLWSLEMDGKAFHRLGYAKPLGFGSLRLTISEAELHDASARYGKNWRDQPKKLEGKALIDWKQPWLDAFKSAMTDLYGESFETLAHLNDMLCLLGEPKPDLPIHYPRSDEQAPASQQPGEETKNFEWFMGNKRNPDARHVLELPGEEKGLPLLDKRGNEKEPGDKSPG